MVWKRGEVTSKERQSLAGVMEAFWSTRIGEIRETRGIRRQRACVLLMLVLKAMRAGADGSAKERLAGVALDREERAWDCYSTTATTSATLGMSLPVFVQGPLHSRSHGHRLLPVEERYCTAIPYRLRLQHFLQRPALQEDR